MIGVLIFSCQKKKEVTVQELKYEKLDFYKIDSFDLRIEKFISDFENFNDFVFIDYETCTRCSEDKIDNFFMDLSRNEEINIIFNDSAVFCKFNSDYPNILWSYVDADSWKIMQLESSNILRYKRIKNKKVKRVY